MSAAIKAIVFKTARLKETRNFFEEELGLQIKESSVRHFVVYSKNIRLVFVESFNDFKVEMYINDKSDHCIKESSPETNIPHLKSFKDPNGIHIIVT